MTNNEIIRILLIEDEEFDVLRVQSTISMSCNRVEIRKNVSDGMAAVELLTRNPDDYDIIIMDFQIAGGLFGESLIRRIKEINPFLQIIVITKMTLNITDFDFANSLIQAGAFWYCTKYPPDVMQYIYQPTDFIIAIKNAFNKKKLEEEKQRSFRKLQANVDALLEEKRIIGSSQAIKQLSEQIEKYALSESNIMILGASGTGKELVANQLHLKSWRKFEKLVTLNCGSLPSELVESELFGYEKGAFTGADKPKKGLFEIADKGTIFLDEIGDLPMPAQAKLLRVIENGEIEKIGRINKIKVDVRIIAATNIDLKKAVKEKKFREDLYYRLNIIPIMLPLLCDRSEDIPELIDYYLSKFGTLNKVNKPKLPSDCIKALIKYNWPGNIRELINVTQRIILNSSGEITLNDVLSAIGILKIDSSRSISQLDEIFDKNEIFTLKELKLEVYKKYVSFVRANSNSDSDAAEKLGLARSNFSRLCSELGLNQN